MKRRATSCVPLAACVAFALLAGGCLMKETKCTLSLQPDGRLTWTVLERNIHATGDSPADRTREEYEYMEKVRTGQHPNIVAFRLLGAEDVRSQVVSATWPFAVLTEARFGDIAAVFQRFLDKLAPVYGRSVLERNGERTTWKVSVAYDPHAEPSAVTDDEQSPEISLFDDDEFVVFMKEGQFVDAVGFQITDDGRVAKCSALEDHNWEKEPNVTLSLTWVAREARK